jgi:hypothetical protein
MSPTVWMSPARDDARAFLAHDHALGAFALHLDRDVLDVQDDVGHVLAHAGDRGEFVQHAVDVDRLSRRRPAARTAARGAARCRASVPKPRSSGSATTVAMRFAVAAG